MKIYPLAFYVIVLLLLITIDFIIFILIKSRKPKLKSRILWFHFSLSAITLLSFISFIFSRFQLFTSIELYVITLFIGWVFLVYFPKLIFLILNAFKIVFRKIIRRFRNKNHWQNAPLTNYYASFILSSILFCVILYGMTLGKSNFKTYTIDISSEKIPVSFDHFKIVQFSDIHLGNWMFQKEKVTEIVKLMNAQNPDLIVFTGDLVNSYAQEALPFISILKKLKAKHGIYSILGNHDYSAYNRWANSQDKNLDHQCLLGYQKQMGFELLNNASTIIHEGTDSIALIGIENWGRKPFPQLGNYDLAAEKALKTSMKILLSHDPDHWIDHVVNKTDVLLTLSGHTHGGQIGIEIGKCRWSPVQNRFKMWAGLYFQNGQYLYVNRGIGFLGIPIRLGIPPEITVITLHSKKK